MMTYSYCVYNGRLDIVEVENGQTKATSRVVPTTYLDGGVGTNWPITEDKREMMARPSVELRFAGVRDYAHYITLIGEAWEGVDPPAQASLHDDVLRQRVIDYTSNWIASRRNAALALDVSVLRHIFSAQSEPETYARLSDAIEALASA